MRVRYADGRAAITHDATCEIGDDALTLSVGETSHTWAFAATRRADDGASGVILKRKPDTGERIFFDPDDTAELKARAPELFTARTLGREGPGVVIGLVAAAWSLAGVFLVGVPMLAAPIADHIPSRYRDQIADISWSQVDALTNYCDDSDEAARILNDLTDRLMATSNVPQREQVWVTIVDAPFPNAFALPDNSIVVTDDLIALAENPDELTGVLAHEIAHIEHNHIMKNLIRHVGVGIFFDVVVGGAGAGQALALASVDLAGLSYSRDDESDADRRGLDYLDAANIDTGALARLFDRFAEQAQEHGATGMPTLFSSHPATAERAAAARARARPGRSPSLTDAEWQVVRSACGGGLQNQIAPETDAGTTPGAQPAPADEQPLAGGENPDGEDEKPK